MTESPFSERVREAFSRRVASYEPLAALQRGMAWRLAGVARRAVARRAVALPEGPCADLGAGTGLLGRALAAWNVPLPSPLQQLDLCPESLARNGCGPPLAWDLNQGLPPHLSGAALLASSFALQWLDAPADALQHWGEQLAPGGWLLLTVPTAGSFPEWRQAAQRSGVPCSALPFPAADALLAAATRAGLETIQAQVLTFSGQRPGGRNQAGSGQGSGEGSRRAAGTAALPSASGLAAPAGARDAAGPSAEPAEPAKSAPSACARPDQARPSVPPIPQRACPDLHPAPPPRHSAPPPCHPASAGVLPAPAGVLPDPAAVPQASPAPQQALAALRALRAIGASATPHATSLSPGDWRRLLAAWPAGGQLSWEVLLLVARKPPAPASSPSLPSTPPPMPPSMPPPMPPQSMPPSMPPGGAPCSL